jgi:hypothetical protein
MAITNLQVASEALKNFYLPGLRYQMNDKASAFIAQIEKSSDHVEGSQIVMALRYGRQGGVGNRADDGTLPTPNSRKTKQAKWETKNFFARFMITEKLIQASRSNTGAFASMLETEIADCETDAKLDLSRQAMGDGTGILATATGTKTSSTVPVSSTMFFAEGMLVDIYDVSGSDYLNTSVEVTAVDDANSTVTLSTVGTIADGDTFYVAGNKDMELTGLEAVFEASTLYGINRSANLWFKANRKNLNGEISELAIQEAIDEADRKAGAEINFLMCSLGVRRAYLNLLTAQKQLVNTMELKGGWKSISFNGIPLVADKYVKSGKLYCLDLSNWGMHQMSDFDWLDRDGTMLSRVANKAAYEATLFKFCDLGCDKPKGQYEIYGITEH